MIEKELYGPFLCAYCGISWGNTVDHVIPKCLFDGPLPEYMVRIPACLECNNQKSKNDSYLRDMLVLDDQASNHPTAQVLVEKVHRAVQKRKSPVGWAIASKSEWKPLHSPNGFYFGHFFHVPLDEVRVQEVFSTLIQGLYYKLMQGKRFPRNYSVKIARILPPATSELIKGFERYGSNGPFVIGNGVFGCFFIYTQEDPGITYWLLQFYRSITFLIKTEPPTAKYKRESKKK